MGEEMSQRPGGTLFCTAQSLKACLETQDDLWGQAFVYKAFSLVVPVTGLFQAFLSPGEHQWYQPPVVFNSSHSHSLGPAIQPYFYSVKSAPIQATNSQFLQESAVGSDVKVLTEVQTDTKYSLLHIH